MPDEVLTTNGVAAPLERAANKLCKPWIDAQQGGGNGERDGNA